MYNLYNITAARAVDREFVYIVGPAGWRRSDALLQWSRICLRALTSSWGPFEPFGFPVGPNNNFTYIELMFVGPDINFTYLKLMFLIQISIFPKQNPYFLGRQIVTVGARVWKGRALKHRACAQNLTCHFGGGT